MDALIGACSSARALLGALLGAQSNNCSSNNCSSSSSSGSSSGHLAALQQQLLQQQQTAGRYSIMMHADVAGGRTLLGRTMASGEFCSDWSLQQRTKHQQVVQQELQAAGSRPYCGNGQHQLDQRIFHRDLRCWLWLPNDPVDCPVSQLTSSTGVVPDV
jgi:hypothetical protein